MQNPPSGALLRASLGGSVEGVREALGRCRDSWGSACPVCHPGQSAPWRVGAPQGAWVRVSRRTGGHGQKGGSGRDREHRHCQKRGVDCPEPLTGRVAGGIERKHSLVGQVQGGHVEGLKQDLGGHDQLAASPLQGRQVSPAPQAHQVPRCQRWDRPCVRFEHQQVLKLQIRGPSLGCQGLEGQGGHPAPSWGLGQGMVPAEAWSSSCPSRPAGSQRFLQHA